MAKAAIFVPSAAYLAQHGAQFVEWAAERGHEVVSVIVADPAAAAEILLTRDAGVVLVGDADHLGPDFEPRIEVVRRAPQVRPRNEAGVQQRRRRPTQLR